MPKKRRMLKWGWWEGQTLVVVIGASMKHQHLGRSRGMLPQSKDGICGICRYLLKAEEVRTTVWSHAYGCGAAVC